MEQLSYRLAVCDDEIEFTKEGEKNIRKCLDLQRIDYERMAM